MRRSYIFITIIPGILCGVVVFLMFNHIYFGDTTTEDRSSLLVTDKPIITSAKNDPSTPRKVKETTRRQLLVNMKATKMRQTTSRPTKRRKEVKTTERPVVNQTFHQYTAAVPLINGKKYRVKDSAFIASSVWDFPSMRCLPQCSRMEPNPGLCVNCLSWSASQDGINKYYSRGAIHLEHTSWIQVSLGRKWRIVQIGTKGRANYPQKIQFTREYVIASIGEGPPEYYPSRKDPLRFKANEDTDTEVKHTLKPPLIADKVRLYITKFRFWASIRWELYGVIKIN